MSLATHHARPHACRRVVARAKRDTTASHSKDGGNAALDAGVLHAVRLARARCHESAQAIRIKLAHAKVQEPPSLSTVCDKFDDVEATVAESMGSAMPQDSSGDDARLRSWDGERRM